MARIPDARVGVVGLVLMGLVPVVGHFASPTAAWGFHLTAYLAPGAWIASVVGWGLLFVSPWRRLMEALLFDRVGESLFAGRTRSALPTLIGMLVVMGGAFWRLSTATHFLGDGILVGEAVGDGAAFHATDGMDYLLHRLAREALAPVGDYRMAFNVYVWGSYLAGLLGVLTAVHLLRRSRMPVVTRTLLLLLWLFSAGSLLFCGYVESYGFLSVALLGFTWSGAMMQRGEAPPWLPGLFFGLALFFHTTALLALPALLWLTLRPGPTRAQHGLVSLWVPALLFPFLALLAHIALGYDANRFKADFLVNPDSRSMLVPLTGDHGPLSVVHWKDLINWILLVIPVPAWMILSHARQLLRRMREPDLSFLCVHGLCLAAAFVMLDRKLGAARDWDIFVPHVAGLGWVAVRLWEPETTAQGRTGVWPGPRLAACWVALLLAWPWFAVNATREASVRRFIEMRADFAPYPRAYASQDVANYFRDAGDQERAVGFYEEAVQAFPQSTRFRALLADGYLALGRAEAAGEQRDEVLKMTPNYYDEEARLTLRRREYSAALDLYRSIVRRNPDVASAWAGLGYAAFKTRNLEEARGAFIRASALADVPDYDYYAGIACASLGQWDEAVVRFQKSVRGNQSRYYHGLAVTLEGREAAHRARGRAVNLTRLREAAQIEARAAQLAPDDPRVVRYREHITRVLAGLEPPTTDPPR